MLIEDGQTLAITNGGGPFGGDDFGSVTFVDVGSRKLLEALAVAEPRLNAGHVALGPNRAFVLVSAPRDGLPETDLGGVSLRRVGGPLVHVTEPRAATSRMIGEALSVCIHEASRTALATHPFGGLVTFWNVDTGRLFAAFDLPHARGVTLTLDKKYFAVSFGTSASLLFIRTAPLEPLVRRDHGARRFGGSHLYTWSPPSQRGAATRA